MNMEYKIKFSTKYEVQQKHLINLMKRFFGHVFIYFFIFVFIFFFCCTVYFWMIAKFDIKLVLVDIFYSLATVSSRVR